MKSFMVSILLTAIKGQYDAARRVGARARDEYGQQYSIHVVHEDGQPVLAIRKEA